MSASKVRTDNARRRANQLGLRVSKRGNIFRLYDGDKTVEVGELTSIEAYLAQRLIRRRKGPPPSITPTPAAWAMIDDYLVSLAAVGQRDTTLELRRVCLLRIARGLGCPPDAVTGELLVEWFGQQTQWAIETRRLGASSWAAWRLRRALPPLPRAGCKPPSLRAQRHDRHRQWVDHPRQRRQRH